MVHGRRRQKKGERERGRETGRGRSNDTDDERGRIKGRMALLLLWPMMLSRNLVVIALWAQKDYFRIVT